MMTRHSFIIGVFCLLAGISATAQSKKIDIVFIGNSITHGAGHANPEATAPPVKATEWLRKNLPGAVMALSAMGTVLAVLFVVLAAPDVAQSEIVVGAIALPTLYLLAIGKIRADVRDRGELGEEGGDDD